MIKGCNKRVIWIRNTENELFEQAYFILSDSARVNDRSDAEDLCQDVFEKAFRAADRYDPSRSAPGTWLYAITRNTVINYYRRCQ